ncbi:GTP-binding protein rhb1 [Psilocybe cubensis]|uniref:GTP-binding protein rhb1 n=2 Tax=Psilocybe cubensis TaxID=181762 RepID=A0A8H7Y1V6_PSICU|nr:GTP-binding protein rhb1 [Psilocybe cubensis]KAH9483066.1 GTP-binding protein rhb1 [Psilocybe cubensis]
MPPSAVPKRRKIVVLGSRSVGKSSLVVQFIENHFVDAYYPTIESIFQKTLKYNGVEFECEIIDTAGQDEFSIFNSKHAIGIHGYVLVYSVASRNSFNMVQTVYDKIIDFCGTQDVPCVIVGSKTDLQSSSPVPSRQVEPSEGERLAQQNHAAWVETSAKNNTNVDQVFELCLAEIEKRSERNLLVPPSSTTAATKDKGYSCCIM